IASLPGVALRLTAQSGTPAEVAAKLMGRWKLNTELTPTFTKPGRGRGGLGGAVSFARASALVQRGGRGGGGGGGGGQPGDASAQVEMGSRHAAPGVLERAAQARETVERRRERSAGARREGRERHVQLRIEGRVRPAVTG